MILHNLKMGLAFDDVLLIPQYSKIPSRSTVDLSVDLGKGIVLKNPIVSANMKHVTEVKMAKTIANLGGLALLHRFFDNPLEDIPKMFLEINNSNNVGCSIGIQDHDQELIRKLVDAGCKIICLDVAHAHTKRTGEMVSFIAKNFPEVLLIAGTVATKEGAIFLNNHGADVIRCGIGSGSICTTRIETGNGYPLLSSLDECVNPRYKLMADGGMRTAGDLTKALCFADCVMLGSLLSATEEAPGDIITHEGISKKRYDGSSTFKPNRVEGVSCLIPLKGSVVPIIQKLLEGLASGCSYQGATNLKELKNNPQFVRITNAGLVESHPHNIYRTNS